MPTVHDEIISGYWGSGCRGWRDIATSPTCTTERDVCRRLYSELYNHLGGCIRIPGDHVSSVGPMTVTVDIATSPTCTTEKDVYRRLYSELYNHLGGCSHIPGDHVSSVGPVPVYLPSTTLALRECQYLLTCLQTVNNNWRLLVVTCDVVCRHSSTVNIDSWLLMCLLSVVVIDTGIYYFIVTYWALAETRNHSELTSQGTLQTVHWGACHSICAMAERATTG